MMVHLIDNERIERLFQELDHLKLLIQSLQPGDRDRWYTTEDLCRRFRLSKRTLQNYRDRKLIKFSQIGNKIFYKHSDVEEFFTDHKVK